MREGFFFSLTLTVNVDFEGVYAQTYLRFFPGVWGGASVSAAGRQIFG